tara:strand:- start:78 stop:863 length:786 start_codon:yes stop_codon:yes gene_type:complete
MEIKKWFFGLNSDSEWTHNYERYIKCAVNSALENTTLEPHFLYDDINGDIDIISWLEEKNITIHRITSRFIKEMEKENNYSITTGKGAFLRVEIPEIVKNNYDDEYVLYTDCDVIFLNEFSFKGKCEFFSCAPEFDINNWGLCNTGAMVMNINNLYDTLEEFTTFIKNYGISKFPAFDQGAYNIFYKNKWDKLNPIYNWKPYWGIEQDVGILHFHGLKIENIEKILEGKISEVAPVLSNMYQMNNNSYKHYYEIAKKYEEQ